MPRDPLRVSHAGLPIDPFQALMQLVIKLAVGLLLVALLVIAGAAAALYLNAAKPERPVGFARLSVPDPEDAPLDVGVWYPTDSRPGFGLVGISPQIVAGNGNVAGRSLPLIVISHGNGGLLSSHSDTALALASAGFVVAAVTHTGDNAQDDRYVGTPRWLVDRPRHVRLVLDHLLGQWQARAQLDPSRIGVFGFSAGAFTALVAMGGVPDLTRIDTHCRTHQEVACQLWKQSPAAAVAPARWVHDSRIRAAVVAAPGYGFTFEPDGLSQVKAEVELWNGAEDNLVPYDTNVAPVRRLLPNPPEYHVVPGAGHFAFLAPCPAWLFPMICKDPQGFDRTAFHRDFNRAVVAFYQRALGPQ